MLLPTLHENPSSYLNGSVSCISKVIFHVFIPGALSVQANRDENYEYQYEGYMYAYDLNTTYQTKPNPKPAAQAFPPVNPNEDKEEASIYE